MRTTCVQLVNFVVYVKTLSIFKKEKGMMNKDIKYDLELGFHFEVDGEEFNFKKNENSHHRPSYFSNLFPFNRGHTIPVLQSSVSAQTREERNLS